MLGYLASIIKYHKTINVFSLSNWYCLQAKVTNHVNYMAKLGSYKINSQSAFVSDWLFYFY